MKLEFRVKEYKCCICEKGVGEVLETDAGRYCESCVSKALEAQYKKESDIIRDIENTKSLFRIGTGLKPTKMYLGTRQIQLLLQHLGLTKYPIVGTVCGLPVFKVDDYDHLQVR